MPSGETCVLPHKITKWAPLPMTHSQGTMGMAVHPVDSINPHIRKRLNAIAPTLMRGKKHSEVNCETTVNIVTARCNYLFCFSCRILWNCGIEGHAPPTAECGVFSVTGAACLLYSKLKVNCEHHIAYVPEKDTKHFHFVWRLIKMMAVALFDHPT